MSNRVTARLETDSAHRVLSCLAQSEEPVDFRFKDKADLVLAVYINGCESAYKLQIRSNGSWILETFLEV